ncbi:Site-specific integrase [Pseudomonas sp. IT-P258]|uniref:hypothetical protein n=1 Tax=Pseudomonas sp. IT-P258 TaxID=3026447 RepID=UPI0039E1C8D4
MRKPSPLPDLTFASLEFAFQQTEWDLSCLVYLGAAKVKPKTAKTMIYFGKCGSAQPDRLELVSKIHEVINDKIISGASNFTTQSSIAHFRRFFSWADDNKLPLNPHTVQNTYLSWTDFLVYRNKILKNIAETTAYSLASGVSRILDDVLDRNSPLISLTRLRSPNSKKRAQEVKVEKQNLEDMIKFGHFLQDVCDALSTETVLRGSIPIRIPLRHGGEMIEWSGWHTKNRTLKEYLLNDSLYLPRNLPPVEFERSITTFKNWEAEGTLRTRSPLARRRVEAELLMFISQTGMNFTQTHQLKLQKFSYSSYIDGYQVYDRKPRRGGNVLFQIFKDYKPHFERYLDWRSTLFPDTDLIFPLSQRQNYDSVLRPTLVLPLICKNLGVKFFSPQNIRNTRVNWILRRSGDIDLTAEMAQHHVETLVKIYERPSQQRAIGEIMRFWSEHDPSEASTDPVAPGKCNGKPVKIKSIPTDTPKPDCLRASGCMLCEHHRDIDCLDYLWALACFRHLKIIELSKWTASQREAKSNHVEYIINRISEKLRWFGESNSTRRAWLEESLNRVDEGYYHPEWARRISMLEGAS